MITVISINVLGDALPDLLDVREAKDLAHAWSDRSSGASVARVGL